MVGLRTIRLDSDTGQEEFAVGVRSLAIVNTAHGLGQRVEDERQTLVARVCFHVHRGIRLAAPVWKVN